MTGSTLSLQIPVDLTLALNLNSPGTIRFAGTFTATGAIPEPSTWALAAIGLSGLAIALRRK